MARSVRTAGLAAVIAAGTAVLTALILPGCMQNQDNAPITVSHSPGRALSVACSTDGAVAYVTDGRNIYRYGRRSPAEGPSWECILSQGERLELATQHDPREPQPAPATPEQSGSQKQEPRSTAGK